MKLFCCGFNLYGQFLKHPPTVKKFTECVYDGASALALSHTFALISKNGEFFLLRTKTNEVQTERIQISEEFKVTDFSCSDSKILFLCQNGVLLQLDLTKCDEVLKPTRVPGFFSGNEIVKIACGSKINVGLSRDGYLFNFPNKLDFINKNIVDICVGREHCAVLDGKGNIYSFGRGSRGQLGHGTLEDETEPKLVEGLAGIKISKIAAGGWHTCAVSAEGDLYTWGWNGNGQLGIRKTNEDVVAVMATPHLVEFDQNVVDVACGNRHTVALLDNKQLFGAGWNKYNQLGNEDTEDENFLSMTFLKDFKDFNIIDLKCGPWSTAVVIEQT